MKDKIRFRQHVRAKIIHVCDHGIKILVELKSSKYKPFICKAKEFVFGEEETRVEFIRLEETVFPADIK